MIDTFEGIEGTDPMGGIYEGWGGIAVSEGDVQNSGLVTDGD